MQIEIKELYIDNFKGTRDQTITFGKTTNISGDNGAGKSSVFDAFSWVLFGVDSLESPKFSPRPRDSDGKDIDHIDICVILHIDVNGKMIKIQKIQKQNWVKKRGQVESVFSGNENLYEWNDIPITESVFNEKVKGIINKSIFKLVTNPLSFVGLKWKEQRECLVKLISDITDEDVFAMDEEFFQLRSLLMNNSIDELRAKNKKAITAWNKTIESIPVRIDEISKTIFEVDYSAQEKMLASENKRLEEIESQFEDNSRAYEETRKKQKEIFAIKNELQQIKFDAESEKKKQLNEIERKRSEATIEFNNYQRTQRQTEQDIEFFENKIFLTESELEKLRNSFNEESTKYFNESNCICSTCGQEYPESKKDEERYKFNLYKSDKLKSINLVGKNYKTKLESQNKELEECKANLANIISKKDDAFVISNRCKKEIDNFVMAIDIDSLPVVIELEKRKEELEKTIHVSVSNNDVLNDLKAKKHEIVNRIDEIKKVLNSKEAMEKAKIRISNLKSELKEVSQLVANAEQQEFLFERFIKAKMNLLSEKINSKFRLVKWKLFDTQVNGAVVECCECMIDGVSFQSLNKAKKLNAGLDIINTLSRFYDFYAPVFIDDREGVSEIEEMNSQVVNLIVVKGQKFKVEVE